MELKRLFSVFSLVAVAVLVYISSASAKESPEKKRVLLAAPVCEKPAILIEFLNSLKRLDRDGYTLDYCFIDDNILAHSSELLHLFDPPKGESTMLIVSKNHHFRDYFQDDEVVYWNENLIWKIAAFKDRFIALAKTKGYDYLFLIDSDLLLHPKTLSQLIQSDKEIVSTIYWTQWSPESQPLPQVWLLDHDTRYPHKIGEVLSEDEINKRQTAFLKMLKTPGIYEIGGVSSCTLISKNALNKGVSFQRIKNITMQGEDRHFSIRAAALGISLYVDTHYPAYHIYRESDLQGARDFIEKIDTQIPINAPNRKVK